MALIVNIVLRLLATVIFILLNSGILWITTKLFALEEDDYQTSLLISIITGSILFVFSSFPFIGWLSGVLIHLVIIALLKRFYVFSWKKTIAIWLLWLIMFILLAMIVATAFVMI